MSWITKHLNPQTRDYAAAESSHPYLVALLLSDEVHAAYVRARVTNWLRAREAEAQRPAVVDASPCHVVLDPSSVCNLRCPLCVQATDPDGRPRTLVKVDRYEHVVREIAGHAIRLDLFNWGEPLLHPSFAALVKSASGRSLYVRTSSHMSHTRGYDWDSLVASGLKYVVASIDGATQTTYERYRVGGRLDAAVSNVAALVAAKRSSHTAFPIVEWQFLATSDNAHEIEAAERIARDVGVDVFRYRGARGQMSLKTLSRQPICIGRRNGICSIPVIG